jgi:hypothetical protein
MAHPRGLIQAILAFTLRATLRVVPIGVLPMGRTEEFLIGPSASI